MAPRKKIAVVLNGSGHRDGSEIHEAVMTLLGIEEAGADWECLALNRDQAHVMDHVSGNVAQGQRRNMLTESARIARGKIRELSAAHPDDYDGVVLPGGNGTAANLCNFASAGSRMEVDKTLSGFLESMHGAGKPIGAICISPVILAKIFGSKNVHVTLGSTDNSAAQAAQGWGAKTYASGASECVIDDNLKMVTTPAYMCDTTLSEAASGIRKLAKTIVAMA